jgi:hypothetical protein
MDKRYGVIISGGDAGGIRCCARRGRPFQPRVHGYAGGAVKLIGAAAKTAGTDPEVMI